MSELKRATITLNDTNFDAFQLDCKCYLGLEQVSLAVGMEPDLLIEMGRKAELYEDIKFIGPKTLTIGGRAVTFIEINDVTIYWALVGFQHGNQRAWKFVEAVLSEALS
jgi:hypothetical protein